MSKKSMKTSFVLKMIAMFVLPIFIIILVINTLAAIYAITYPEIKETTDFFDTKAFSDVYTNELYSTIRDRQIEDTQIVQGYDHAVLYSEGQQVAGFNIYYYYYNTNFKYLLINKKTNDVYTNFKQTSKTDTVDKMKNEILQYKRYWILENENITTNISDLSEDNFKYDFRYENMKQIGDYEIYTAFDAAVNDDNRITAQAIMFDISSRVYQFSYVLLPISILGTVLLSIYLCMVVGHRDNSGKIYLNGFNRVPLGLILIIDFCIIATVSFIIMGTLLICVRDLQLGVILTVMALYLSTIIGLYMIGDMLKRIKSGTFLKNSITYLSFDWVRRKINKILEAFMYNKKRGTKVTLLYGTFVFISVMIFFIALWTDGFAFWGLVILAFWAFCYIKLMKTIKQANIIEETLKNLYEGKQGIKIDDTELTGDFKKISTYVNDISGGFANAIEENLKSERLKTELITNVSHDIKTPLTSIINYVDLLKKEEMPSDKAKEYLEVLDNKSQRLKKLTEDLVEASKASSGNIKLTMERLNVKELITQISGEFEDRFSTRNLEEIATLVEDTYIKADNRYLYRVLENVYSNIAKYALEGSRVYIDTFVAGENVVIQLKNISKEKLNITSEELMQRFVRGDSARNTEGSGLGLSIAQSLTQLQDGKFEMYLDGDLFKVTIEFKKVE